MAHRNQGSGGFTLLEVLLAAGLIILTMSAVMGFYRFALESRRLGGLQVQRAQTARLLLEQIAHDLRGIAPNTVKYTPVLRGNGEIIECLTAAVPDPRLFADQKITDRRIAREMDLRRIMWFMAVNKDELDENRDPTVVGIVRRSQRNLDPFRQFSAEQLVSDEEKRTFNDQLVNTEVKFLEFAFYDGQKWLRKWDMTGQGPETLIPVAIRVTVGFSPLPSEELDRRRDEDKDPMETNPKEYLGRYTTIVRLPAADVMLGTVSRMGTQLKDELQMGGSP